MYSKMKIVIQDPMDHLVVKFFETLNLSDDQKDLVKQMKQYLSENVIEVTVGQDFPIRTDKIYVSVDIGGKRMVYDDKMSVIGAVRNKGIELIDGTRLDNTNTRF